MTSSSPEELRFDELLDCARDYSRAPGRTLLGIAGSPGAGKSTLAEALHAALNAESATTAAAPVAALFSMDGFHLANPVLDARGLRERKGAVDTFDLEGFLALLHGVRAQGESGTPALLYAPEFDRVVDASIGSALEIHAATRLVIVEGNYLLHGGDGWDRVAQSLDQTWFIEPPESLRQERLIRRHEALGLSPEAAAAWALGTDERNAQLIARSSHRADRRFFIPSIPTPPRSGA